MKKYRILVCERYDSQAIQFLQSKLSCEVILQQSKKQSLEDYVSIQIADEGSFQVDHIGIRELVARLEPAYKEAIDLVYFVGFTQEEAAEKLKIPLGTLKSRCRIAIRELRKWI